MGFAPYDQRDLLRCLCGSRPFSEYCRRRGIRFRPARGRRINAPDFVRWNEALARLSRRGRVRVERDLEWIGELSHPTAQSLLILASRGRHLPPESIPEGPPFALWFLLHRRRLCHDLMVGLCADGEVDWREAHVASGHALRPLSLVRISLTTELRRYFRALDGTGRFCAVESYRIGRARCFVARVSGRPRLLNGFTASGRRSVMPARPELRIVFVFDSSDGRLLLLARSRGRDFANDMFGVFGRAALGVRISAINLAPVFYLDRLKRRFHAVPDADDMESVRVRSLHLSYPERSGRRRLKLETLPGDGPNAMWELLRSHGGGGELLDSLTVIYAELEVMLRTKGRLRIYRIRLWREGCSLADGALAERFRRCLFRWGLVHDG